MPKKEEHGLVGLVRGVSIRFERAEEKLTELENEGKHFAKNIERRLAEIEKLENSISESNTAIAELEERRDELRREWMEASFNGDAETERAIKAERANLDKQLEHHTAERNTAESKVNQLRSTLNTTREDVYAALEELTIPSEDNFIDTFIEALRYHTSGLEKRMAAVELLYELPEEREEREAQEREAKERAEKAEKLQERQELIQRRNRMGKLLNNLSHLNEPHTGFRAWIEYLEQHDIEFRTESNGHSTFIGLNDSGEKTKLDPQSIVSDVRGEYYKAMEELGEEIQEPDIPQSNPRLTRSHFVSVM